MRNPVQKSVYEHEPTFIGLAAVPTFVHLTGKGKPEIVLMTFIVVGSIPEICLRLVTFASIVIGPG